MTYDHVQFFEANAFYVLSVYFLTGGIFFYCFYKQLAFSPRDSLLLSGVLAIALFMFWLLVNHMMALLGVLFVLSAVLVVWAVRNR